jgi:hypothetical protein
MQGKISEISESHAATLAIDLAARGISANHLRDLNVE